jgi:alanine dehydrogenase
MEKELAITVKPVEHPEEAVASADIVATCTDSKTPVLCGRWLSEGTHLTCVRKEGEWDDDVSPKIDVAIGGDAPRSPIFGTSFARGQANCLTYAAGDPELLEQLPRWPDKPKGNSARPRLVPLKSMIRGEGEGRRNSGEISASGGSLGTQGLPFVGFAAKVYEYAKAKGLGRHVPTELFLQNIRD